MKEVFRIYISMPISRPELNPGTVITHRQTSVSREGPRLSAVKAREVLATWEMWIYSMPLLCRCVLFSLYSGGWPSDVIVQLGGLSEIADGVY